MLELTKYIKIQEGISGNVLLCFSSIGIPQGKFSSTNALKKSKHTVIYINTSDNDWYINGIPGIGGKIDDSVSLLTELILKYKSVAGTVCSYGGSMGGYGSLLYGCLLRVDLILATCPESEIYIPNGYSDRLSKKKYAELPNIYEVVKKAVNSGVQIKLFYGSNPSLDYISAIKLAKICKVSINFIRFYGHKIPLLIEGRFGLNNFIDQNMNSSFVLPCEDISLIKVSDITDEYKDYVVSKKNKNDNWDYSNHEIYRNTGSIELKMHYIWETYISHNLRKHFDYNECINYFLPCIDCEYPLPKALSEIATKAFKAKQYSLAGKYFKILIEKYHEPKINRVYWKALIKYSLCLKFEKDIQKAQIIALQASDGLGRIIKNHEYYIELADLYIKVALIEQAQEIAFKCLKYQPNNMNFIALQQRIFKRIKCTFFIEECNE